MKKYFITGLAIFLPLAITLLVIGFLIDLFTEPFVGIVSQLVCYLDIGANGFLFLSSEQVVRYTSQLLILIMLFLVVMGLGIITRAFFIHALFRLGDAIIGRIPVVNTVYKTTQDIIKTLFAPDKNTFKQVVMAPFPRPGSYVLGLVSADSPSICSKLAGEDLVTILVPTTPNPTTGFLLMYKRWDLIYLEIKPEEAIKYIVSCGVIAPKSQAPIVHL